MVVVHSSIFFMQNGSSSSSNNSSGCRTPTPHIPVIINPPDDVTKPLGWVLHAHYGH